MRDRHAKFAGNDSGAIAILFALTLTVLCLCVGGAIDFARHSNARTQTAAALDAAILAGARTLLLGGTATAAKAAAEQYYAKNVTDRFDVLSDTVAFAVTDNGTAISGTGNAYLATTFLRLAGIDSLPLIASSGSQFPKAEINSGGGSNIEVSIMLDLTGSMCGNSVGPCASSTKLDALKLAAKDLVNIVVHTDQSTNKSRVALVPFSGRVRVAPNNQGANLMTALTGLPATWSGWITRCTGWTGTGTSSAPESGNSYSCDGTTTEQVSNWHLRPCVTERGYNSSGSMETSDDAPATNAWLNAYSGDRKFLSLDSANTPMSTGIGATSGDPASEHMPYGSSAWCDVPNANVIQPLTSDKAALASKIDAFEAHGSTAGALGTSFAWYMLSPKWNSIWPAANAADPYSDLSVIKSNGRPKLRKVAVLMSDGVFNAYRNWTGQNQQTVSNYAKALCANMKASGIEIYTVGFDLDALQSTERSIAIDTLQSCGTSLNHFYNSLDAVSLQSAFRDIAVKMSSISLTQ